MKIEYGDMRITEVPYVAYIDVNNATCAIKFIGLSPIVFTEYQLREFHAAISEAVKYMGAPVVEKPSEPRTWNDGDPEPDDIAAVIDCDDDVWKTIGDGDWRLGDGTLTRCWHELVRLYGPVREEL